MDKSTEQQFVQPKKIDDKELNELRQLNDALQVKLSNQLNQQRIQLNQMQIRFGQLQVQLDQQQVQKMNQQQVQLNQQLDQLNQQLNMLTDRVDELNNYQDNLASIFVIEQIAQQMKQLSLLKQPEQLLKQPEQFKIEYMKDQLDQDVLFQDMQFQIFTQPEQSECLNVDYIIEQNKNGREYLHLAQLDQLAQQVIQQAKLDQQQDQLDQLAQQMIQQVKLNQQQNQWDKQKDKLKLALDQHGAKLNLYKDWLNWYEARLNRYNDKLNRFNQLDELAELDELNKSKVKLVLEEILGEQIAEHKLHLDQLNQLGNQMIQLIEMAQKQLIEMAQKQFTDNQPDNQLDKMNQRLSQELIMEDQLNQQDNLLKRYIQHVIQLNQLQGKLGKIQFDQPNQQEAKLKQNQQTKLQQQNSNEQPQVKKK